jgi:hypothetical protein
MQYVKDTAVVDTTSPPAPTNVRADGNELTWEAEADLESGLAGFIIQRDGQFLANVPEQPKNPFGRPLFQNLQYSDTPTQPLARMHYQDIAAPPGNDHSYQVIAINTAGLKSKPVRHGQAAQHHHLDRRRRGLDAAGGADDRSTQRSPPAKSRTAG